MFKPGIVAQAFSPSTQRQVYPQSLALAWSTEWAPKKGGATQRSPIFKNQKQQQQN